MTTTVKETFNGGTPTALTITLNSLTNTSARQSTAMDFTSSLPIDVQIDGVFKTASGSLGANPALNLWFSPSIDGTNFGGTNGTNVIGGGDAAFTMPANRANLVFLGAVPINTAAAIERFSFKSLLAALGSIPQKGVLIVENVTGLTLDSSAGGSIQFLPINFTNG